MVESMRIILIIPKMKKYLVLYITVYRPIHSLSVTYGDGMMSKIFLVRLEGGLGRGRARCFVNNFVNQIEDVPSPPA